MLQTYVKITVTMQWAISSLYTVKAATLSWMDVYDRVIKLRGELETLLPQMTRERSILHFAWFDAMMIITRPCLVASQADAKQIAGQCIQAARSFTSLLPDEPNERFYVTGPWWCLAHYILRAVGIFMMATSSQVHFNAASQISPDVKKLGLWLQWMAPSNPIAAQGLEAVQRTLKHGPNYREYAGTYEQELKGAFGEGYSSFVGDRWDQNLSQPQFLDEFHGMDDLLDSDGVITAMVSQARPDMLPMPPIYGDPFG